MIYLGADHAGYQLKEVIKIYLSERGLEYTDLGTDSEESVDFPNFAFAVSEKVAHSYLSDGTDIGILLCGSGAGMVIAANKVKGVYAAVALNEYMGKQIREHDEANILVLPARVVSSEDAQLILNAYLDAPTGGEERHMRRMQQIRDYEEKHIH